MRFEKSGNRIFSLAALWLAYFALATAASPHSGDSQVDAPDLAALSLQQLLEVEVCSARRKTEPFSDAACALFVLTGEEARRLGPQSLPELFRTAPGVHVARISASKWAVTARGFNGRFANKLLVLVDGRTLYTPLYGGVVWDIHEIMVQDLDRIEIIRGPRPSAFRRVRMTT